jgi:hypothetical protein
MPIKSVILKYSNASSNHVFGFTFPQFLICVGLHMEKLVVFAPRDPDFLGVRL